MADWDAADLLARAKRLAGVPATTTFPADADWYSWLTDGQLWWMGIIAAHAPESQYGDPTLLTTSDGGETYDFPSSAEVLACELYDRKDGRLLSPGAYWNPNKDYVFEMNKIRFPLGAKKTFASGPYARFVAEPGKIAAGGSDEPVLRPLAARMLIIARACVLFATRGGRRDPAPYEALENKLYYGIPERRIIGLVDRLKAGDTFGGMQAFTDDYAPWYQTIDVGGWIP